MRLGRCRCRCRACGSTRSASASPPQIQRARRTGLTFAPEAGTWRMRQVINKLIREEDLYGAVESAYCQGWRRVKLYFLTGLPTETDEDTLGIAELASNCVEHRQAAHQAGRRSRSRSAGSCPSRSPRSSGSGRTPSTSCSARSTCCATPPARCTACSSSGTTRRPPWSRASPAAAIAASAPVIEEVWRSGGMFQEWSEHFDLDRWPRPWTDARLSSSTGTSTATAPRTRSCRGITSRPGLHKDFLWQDWRDALAEVGLADCRWTPCYDCGACTGYGIEHVVASATPPAGGCQGTGQDLSSRSVPVTLGRRSAVTAGATSPGGAAR